MEKEEKFSRDKSLRVKIIKGVFLGCLVAVLTVYGISLIIRSRKITYPVDILVDSPAPLYQSDFPLEDATFSSNFESGNLRTVV